MLGSWRPYGAATLSELLKKYEDVLEVRKGKHDREYRIRPVTME
jgi:hypothetical protein